MGLAELGVTLKGDGGAPWVTLKGTVDEQSQALSELRERGAWPVICQAAKAFQEAWRQANAKPPTHDQAVAVVKDKLGGEVIHDQALPASMQLVCKECGQVATHKKGISTKGTPYDGFYCPDWHEVK